MTDLRKGALHRSTARTWSEIIEEAERRLCYFRDNLDHNRDSNTRWSTSCVNTPTSSRSIWW